MSNKPSLIIGSTSQLSNYLPENWIRVSSRNTCWETYEHISWNQIHICFSEQRTYLANNPEHRKDFWNTNVYLTDEIVTRLADKAERLVFYSTAELWNKTNGPIDINTPFCFHSNHYTETKAVITERLRCMKHPSITIVYPFNFNSPSRGKEYLFGKVFRSIVNNTPVTLGDLDYYRELIHPSMVASVGKDRVPTGESRVAGSGVPIHIKGFIRNLYQAFQKDFDSLVQIQYDAPSIYRDQVFYANEVVSEFSEKQVFDLTVKELNEYIKGGKYAK